MHLCADLVNGRLRAERGGVRAAVSLHPQAAVRRASRSASVTQRAHQTVHVGLFKRFWFTLRSTHTHTQRVSKQEMAAFNNPLIKQRGCRNNMCSISDQQYIYISEQRSFKTVQTFKIYPIQLISPTSVLQRPDK